jgi:hypothetical protein
VPIVGIGTTSPRNTLEVNGGIRTPFPIPFGIIYLIQGTTSFYPKIIAAQNTTYYDNNTNADGALFGYGIDPQWWSRPYQTGPSSRLVVVS